MWVQHNKEVRKGNTMVPSIVERLPWRVYSLARCIHRDVSSLSNTAITRSLHTSRGDCNGLHCRCVLDYSTLVKASLAQSRKKKKICNEPRPSLRGFLTKKKNPYKPNVAQELKKNSFAPHVFKRRSDEELIDEREYSQAQNKQGNNVC